MPQKGQEKLPDRSKPETTGRELSLDEKKDDVRRLEKYAQDSERLLCGVQNLNCPEKRVKLMEEVEKLQVRFQNCSQLLRDEIRHEIFDMVGHKPGLIGGHYKGGKRGQRGGPNL